MISMDFQGIGSASFADEHAFAQSFAEYFEQLLPSVENSPFFVSLKEEKGISMEKLFRWLSRLCQDLQKPVVLIIDEVDSASNNQVFLDFLAFLRQYYLNRKNVPAFHSVILAGVHDIKNLKMKIRLDAQHKYNSPWNIAANFDLDMNFSAEQIGMMLKEYEADYRTGMKVDEISGDIYKYTSGYPYLVSALCKLMDENIYGTKGFENLADVWTKEGLLEAVKLILAQQAPLFESMIRQLSEYPDLKQMLHALLFQGKRITFNPDNYVINLAAMFGYIINREGSVPVANRIFEMRLYNFFLSEEELRNAIYDEAQGNRNQFVNDANFFCSI